MNASTLNEEQLKRFARRLTRGDFLFRQNDLGNSLFVIVTGGIDLIDHREKEEYVVGTMTHGQILGEKALLTETPYQRAFSARANADTVLLEFDRKNLVYVQTVIPDFATRILQVAAQRLDRANKVIQILKHRTAGERLVHGLLLLNEESGKVTADGSELVVTAEDLVHLTGSTHAEVQTFFAELLKNRLIRPTKNGFLLPNPAALLQIIPNINECIAA